MLTVLRRWFHDEPVLVIKTSIGNRSLLWDIAPQNAVRFNYGANTSSGYGDSPNSWLIGGNPTPYTWYAGKQYDEFFLAEADMMPALMWTTGNAVKFTFPAGKAFARLKVIVP